MARRRSLAVGLSPLQAGLWSLPSAFDEEPATATRPAAVAKPDEPVPLVRVGSGCLACPGERTRTGVPGA